jgi:hypothetical protein
MGEFVDAALAFPTVLFTFPLLVVVGYWVIVLFGGLGGDDDDPGAVGGFMAGIGLGGVPVSAVLSLLIAIAWFASLAGSTLLDRAQTPASLDTALSSAMLAAAVACAWIVTRLLVVPLRRFLPNEIVPSRRDFVGRMCVIRTGRVTQDFGQAEVTAPDGSSAVIQVRQTGEEPLSAGSTALIFDYDADQEFFWVMAYDATLDPNRPVT